MKRKRIWELDFARGFAIIMMIFDHLMYDLCIIDSSLSNFYLIDNPVFNALNNAAEWYWVSGLRFYGHMFFISVFLVVSGISFTFSKSNLNRSLKLLLVSALISLITLLIQYWSGMQTFIIFGIIHMFALATFLTYLVRKIWDNDLFIFILGIVVIALGFSFDFWNMNFIPNLRWEDVPGLILGWKAYGADYFGIIPYWGMILIGTVIGNLFYGNKQTLLPTKEPSEKNLVLFVGRNSLIFFVTHQLVLYPIVFGIAYIFGYRF